MSRFFDVGASDSVSNASNPVQTYPFSYFAWQNSKNLTGAQHIIGLVNPGSSVEFCRLSCQGNAAGDPIRNISLSGGAFSANSTIAYTADVWQSSCGTMEAGANKNIVYLNGGNKATATGQDPVPTTMTTVSIGRVLDLTPANTFDGEIAHCAVWTVILTDAEVLILSHGVNPFIVRHEALALYYPLDGNESPEPEYVAQLNGTVSGAIKSTTGPPVESLENY